MFRHLPLNPILALSALVLVACGGESPTQPSSPSDSFHTPSFATASNSWTRIARMPGDYGAGAVVGVAANTAGQSVAYVFGGTDGDDNTGPATRVYNVSTNTWTTTSSKVYTYNSNGVGNIGGKLYFSGGYSAPGVGSSELWVYDPVTDNLTRKADMPLHTAEGVTGVIGDKLYVLPGTCQVIAIVTPGYCAQRAVRKLFRYNPSTDIWVTKASCPHFHELGVGGVINGNFYVAGGLNDRLAPTANLDVYDPVTNTWKTLAPLPSALKHPSGAVLRARLFVTGETVSGSLKTYAYDPVGNQWGTLAPPPTWLFTGTAAKVLLNGLTRLLVVAGATVFDPDNSQLYTP